MDSVFTNCSYYYLSQERESTVFFFLMPQLSIIHLLLAVANSWFLICEPTVFLLDLWLAKDNRILIPNSSYERILMAPQCRLNNLCHPSTRSYQGNPSIIGTFSSFPKIMAREESTYRSSCCAGLGVHLVASLLSVDQGLINQRKFISGCSSGNYFSFS